MHTEESSDEQIHLELHLLDTGHFALEEDDDQIAGYINNFLDKQVRGQRAARSVQ